MEVEIERLNDKVIFTIHGEIDTRAGVELSEKFQSVVDEGFNHVILNLEDVFNITSAGIGKILKLFKHLNSRGGSISIRGISSNLRLLFREIHLDKIIPIEESSG